MAIDNFDIIRQLMHFDCDGDIYFVEVLRRGKDHGGKDNGERSETLIRDYHIHSFEQFDNIRPEITRLCDTYGARAYIRLNLRNVEDANIYAQIEMLKEQLTRAQTIRKARRTGNTNTILSAKLNRLRSATKVYGSVLGKYSSEPRETAKWIIDIDPERTAPDDPSMDSVDKVADTWALYIRDMCHPLGEDKVICRIPSKTGLHLVTKPFNKDDFSRKYGKDSNGDSFVKDDGITNLYIPDITVGSGNVSEKKPGFFSRLLRRIGIRI